MMENNNLKQKLICKNDDVLEGNEIGPELTLDKEYELQEVHTCGCGQEHFNVGLKMDVNYVECYKCRERLPDNTHWCHSSRFEKK